MKAFSDYYFNSNNILVESKLHNIITTENTFGSGMGSYFFCPFCLKFDRTVS